MGKIKSPRVRESGMPASDEQYRVLGDLRKSVLMGKVLGQDLRVRFKARLLCVEEADEWIALLERIRDQHEAWKDRQRLIAAEREAPRVSLDVGKARRELARNKRLIEG